MSIGRQDYQDRREERIDRLEGRAERAKAQSTDAARRSQALVENIPFGQPILVDHYSAKGHRRTLDRSRKLMDKAVDLGEKADHLEGRADAARNNKAISGDDPDAVQKLQDKLAALQEAQERDKAANAYYRKHKSMKGFPGLGDDKAAKIDADLAEQDASPYSSGQHMPVPAWCLSNRNAEIGRIKKRLAQFQAVDEMEHAEIPFEGGVLITNEEINRVQILFDGKPDDEIRAKLKHNGVRWSPREKAWQTQRTPQNLRRACYLLGLSLPTKPASEEPDPEPQHETPQEIPLTDGFSQLTLS